MQGRLMANTSQPGDQLIGGQTGFGQGGVKVLRAAMTYAGHHHTLETLLGQPQGGIQTQRPLL